MTSELQGAARFALLRRTTPFDPRFAAEDPFFAPIASVAAEVARRSALAGEVFPSPETLDAVLAPLARVRFVRSVPKPRRRREPASKDMYDASIVEQGVVPTRAGSWHDLLNALVWAVFPSSKLALHRAQLAWVRAKVDAATGRMEGARAKAHDALALIDEGGALVMLRDPALPQDVTELRTRIASGAAAVLVFGHALYETRVFGGSHTTARVHVHHVDAVPSSTAAQAQLLDPLFAQVLSAGAIPHEGHLPRLDLGAVLQG